MPLPNPPLTEPQKTLVGEVLSGIEARLDQLELQANPAYYSEYLHEIDTETDAGIYVEIPLLQLAARGLVQGCVRDHTAVDAYYANRILSLMQPLVGGVQQNDVPGISVIAQLVRELAGLLTQSSENSLTRKEMRRSFGGQVKYEAIIDQINKKGLPADETRMLKILAVAIMAGVTSDDRAARIENLKQLIQND